MPWATPAPGSTTSPAAREATSRCAACCCTGAPPGLRARGYGPDGRVLRGRLRPPSAPPHNRACRPHGAGIRRGCPGRRRRGRATSGGVELFGGGLVLGHGGIDVGLGEIQHTHVRECLLHLVAPQADVAQDRHDAHEAENPGTCAAARSDRRNRPLRPATPGFPTPPRRETITHPVARVHAELLTRRSS